jgi:cytochrome c
MMRAVVGIALVTLVVGCAAGCSDDQQRAATMTGGDPSRGRLAIRRHGCGTCHEIPGVGGATSHVGPSLAEIGAHLYLAGHLPNTATNMIEWIRYPQRVVPGNVMPDMGITEADARDIAAFLYTLQ